jgi:hypothetical protein
LYARIERRHHFILQHIADPDENGGGDLTGNNKKMQEGLTAEIKKKSEKQEGVMGFIHAMQQRSGASSNDRMYELTTLAD